MNWTRPADLRTAIQKMWDRGVLLACWVGAEPVFPRRLSFRRPTSAHLVQNFAEFRRWISRLDHQAKHYRIEWRRIQHRILGGNNLSNAIWIDTLDDALALIDRRREAERFTALVNLTRERRPELTAWLQKRPLWALSRADDWPHLLAVVAWMRAHPRPGIYLRQVDIPGVHSKLIEKHRSVLTKLFDRVMPEDVVDRSAGGVSGFCRRYGFRGVGPGPLA